MPERRRLVGSIRAVITGLGVVYLYVKEMERAKGFYRDALGFALEGDHDWVETTLPNGVRFALHLWDEGAAEPSSGGVNLDFEVADIDAAAEHLRAHGVEVGEIHRQPYGSFVTFVDPEGYRLELFQAPAARS